MEVVQIKIARAPSAFTREAITFRLHRGHDSHTARADRNFVARLFALAVLAASGIKVLEYINQMSQSVFSFPFSSDKRKLRYLHEGT